MSSEIRVLLIEDNRFLRDVLTGALLDYGGFSVEACAALEDTADRPSAMPTPEVILLDTLMGDEASSVPMAELRIRFPQSRLVAMDIPADDFAMLRFIRSGGCAFILKSASVEDYVKTIRAVASGSTVLPKSLTTSLFEQIVQERLRESTSTLARATPLTRREVEIVGLIAECMSNKEIAQRLHIATFTVKSHVHNILEKLDLQSRLQIAALVHRQQRP